MIHLFLKLVSHCLKTCSVVHQIHPAIATSTFFYKRFTSLFKLWILFFTLQNFLLYNGLSKLVNGRWLYKFTAVQCIRRERVRERERK